MVIVPGAGRRAIAPARVGDDGIAPMVPPTMMVLSMDAAKPERSDPREKIPLAYETVTGVRPPALVPTIALEGMVAVMFGGTLDVPGIFVRVTFGEDV